MPIISFANPKGGSGKTTAALLLATELSSKGATVTIVDADPEKWISQWGRLPGRPATVTVHSENVTEESIIDVIEEASSASQFVIVDLEGTASHMVSNTLAVSDLVIIPLQGSSMDAKGGAKIIRAIKTAEKLTRRSIPYAVVLTRTSAAVTSRSLRNVQEQLKTSGVDVLATPIVERAAYRDLFDYGGRLSDLSPLQVSNLDKAIANAREFAGEVLSKLKALGRRDAA